MLSVEASLKSEICELKLHVGAVDKEIVNHERTILELPQNVSLNCESTDSNVNSLKRKIRWLKSQFSERKADI